MFYHIHIPSWNFHRDCGEVSNIIKYTIKNKQIEITYDTGFELTFVNYFLRMIDMFNEKRKPTDKQTTFDEGGN